MVESAIYGGVCNLWWSPQLWWHCFEFDRDAMRVQTPDQNAPIDVIANNRRCLNCGKCFSRADAANRHLKNGRCKTFDRTLTRSKRDDNNRRERLNVTIKLEGRKLDLHREPGQKWKCPNSCGKEFQRDDALRLHIKSRCASLTDGVSTLGALSWSNNASTAWRENPQCGDVVPESELNVTESSRY